MTGESLRQFEVEGVAPASAPRRRGSVAVTLIVGACVCAMVLTLSVSDAKSMAVETLAYSFAFLVPPGLVSPSSAWRQQGASTSDVSMQLFGGGRQAAAAPAGQKAGLQPKPGFVVITWKPMGVQSYARPGERLGDAAQKAGINVPYGCKEGVCGTCEARSAQPTGQNNEVRICRDTVPKNNMDAPDREKMWGDLRGGKKSVAELKGAPQELIVTLGNPGLALKRQQSWDQVKEAAAKNTKDWLDPNYKPGQQQEKKGWFR